MSVTKSKIWKYTWKPEGYGLEEVHLDTSKKSVGDTINLPHAYFKAEGFVAYALVNGAYVQLTTGEPNTAGKVDVRLVNRDETLSKSAGANIYAKIKLVRGPAITSNLKIFANFIADTLDMDSFNQDLNQDAEVEHKSLTCSQNITAKKVHAQNRLVAPNLLITEGEANISTPSIKLGDAGLKIENTKVTLLSEELTTANGGSLSYDFTMRRWKSFNEPLITFVGDLTTTPDVGIPIAINNPTGYSFVPWFTVDPVNRTVVVEKLRIGNTTLSEEELLQLKELLAASERTE